MSKTKFSEDVKAASQKQDRFDLVVPTLLPCNGRLILQIRSKEKFIEVVGGLILPSSAGGLSGDNRDSVNPDWQKYRFFIVAMAPEVHEQMRVQDHNGDEINVEVGDEVFLSEYFQAIEYREGKYEYRMIHWQDTLGINKGHSKVKEGS